MSLININMDQDPLAFTLQERALASDMLKHRVGSVVGFVMEASGVRRHKETTFQPNEFNELAEMFQEDPKETLAIGREGIFAIAGDERLSDDSRKRRTERYMDSYMDLTLKLDHAAFPPTKPGEVRKGPLDYMPDGFVDLGTDPTINHQHRSREKIRLDKAAVFEKYRDDILGIFMDKDIQQADNDTRKRLIVNRLASLVYYSIPYDRSPEDGNGKTVDLSSLDEGKCRHHAFAFQTLAQVFGITSRLFKNSISKQRPDGSWTPPERHASNLVRINYKWYVLDATQPDSKDGRWRLGVFEIDAPPKEGETRTYKGTLKHSGKTKSYTSRSDNYWYIDSMAA